MTKDQADKIGINGFRRSGNTTRTVDYLIQELFNTGRCEYWDHADFLGNKALDNALRAIQSRLYNEHGLKQNTGYTINKKDRIIKLTPNRQ
jgi:hypothetical protein